MRCQNSELRILSANLHALQVGAIVFVGAVAKNGQEVQWKLFGNIILTWLLTLPLAGLVSSALTVLLCRTAR